LVRRPKPDGIPHDDRRELSATSSGGKPSFVQTASSKPRPLSSRHFQTAPATFRGRCRTILHTPTLWRRLHYAEQLHLTETERDEQGSCDTIPKIPSTRAPKPAASQDQWQV